MTFQTANYSGTGAQTMKTVAINSDVYVFVKAGKTDKYKIQYKVDAAGLKHAIKDDLKGRVFIEKLGVPAMEVGIHIYTNNSTDITLEIKEY